ncbi:hypothetical protein C1645_743298 [Glomus cerebriforme]|uniref:Uncharacterized protein n=1 Tax=Glomus cerebriforme TaxID=658196 RepID=A0A397SE24_9GLOM|nr:hypothetical protein C1645_743298 [Glomus cerebriforme]
MKEIFIFTKKLPNDISSESEEDTGIYITKRGTVKTIIHLLVPIEYPPTSEEGIAIIYHIKGWENKEAAHDALNNYHGKNLKLVTDIIQGRKLDKERFTAINVHQKYNVPNQGCDKGLIARNVRSNKRKARIQTKRSNTPKSVPMKRRQNVQSNNNKKKNKKTIVIDTNVEEDCCEDDNYEEDNHNKENEFALRLKELEYWKKI